MFMPQIRLLLTTMRIYKLHLLTYLCWRVVQIGTWSDREGLRITRQQSSGWRPIIDNDTYTVTTILVSRSLMFHRNT